MISGGEWIFIGFIAIVLVLWGPKKIPELAKAFGQAKGEFDLAGKEFEKAAKLSSENIEARTSEDILIDTAKNLGIETEGKTMQDLSHEILAKSK